MEIDESRSIEILGGLFTSESSIAAKRSIGRALRRANDQGRVRAMIEGMLTSDLAEERLSGVELAEWQSSGNLRDRLRNIAMIDVEHRVRRAAELSLTRLVRQDTCLDVLNALESASGSRCWSYLESAIKLGDPQLLSTRDDLLWLGRRISEKPLGIRCHAEKLLKRRKEEMEKEEEQEDRRKNDD
jgi:hypothetical protein